VALHLILTVAHRLHVAIVPTVLIVLNVLKEPKELSELSAIAVIVVKVPPRKGAPNRNGALMD
jgi:hypothetical protein